jgi:tRNA A37 methylthiotransferase MiaB
MQVNRFTPERVREDLNYIAEHVQKNIHTLYISDLNFGMLPGDIKTCDSIVEIQNKYNFPDKVLSTTGKNNKEKIIESINRLNGTMALSMSVQSMDQNVLTNIRRANISTEKMIELAPTIKKYNIRTTSEIIMGLPGETYQSHINGIKELIDAEMDYIVIHSCMLLTGSEMATPEERRKWNFKTKFRIIPRDFVKLSSGRKICEIE